MPARAKTPIAQSASVSAQPLAKNHLRLAQTLDDAGLGDAAVKLYRALIQALGQPEALSALGVLNASRRCQAQMTLPPHRIRP